MLDNGKKLLLLGFSILFFSIPFFVEAFEVEYPEISGTQITQASTLPEYFFYIYKFNLFSFFNSDHGYRNGSSLWNWAQDKLTETGVSGPISEIELQTFPRILGFVFNPVSFWFCYKENKLIATIAEVNNTFGETHSYVLPASIDRLEKKLQVSPFFQIEGEYSFAFSQEPDSCSVTINYLKGKKLQLSSQISGEGQDWSVRNLALLWLRQPLFTFTIVLNIHIHALLLWIKKIPFYGKNGKTIDHLY